MEISSATDALKTRATIGDSRARHAQSGVLALRQRIAKNGTGRGGRTLGPFGGSAR